MLSVFQFQIKNIVLIPDTYPYPYTPIFHLHIFHLNNPHNKNIPKMRILLFYNHYLYMILLTN